jgi:hypothetical protein
MKQILRNWVAATAALALVTTLSHAETPTLMVGDPAPPIQPAKWIQGGPITKLEMGKTYLIVFWATWDGASAAVIPRLNDLFTKYQGRGLIVIGQNCFEVDDQAVAPFVQRIKEKMPYPVALDDKSTEKNGRMVSTWMTPAGRKGIPSAFLVNSTGFIAWIGHPMELQEKVLEQVLDSKFDLRQAAETYAKQQKNVARLNAIWSEIMQAMQKKDWDTALTNLNEAEPLTAEGGRDNITLTRFTILLGKHDYRAAYKLVSDFSDAHQSDAALQNEIAWRIVTDLSIEERDLALAEKLANRANEAAKGKEPGILDTLSRIAFMQGRRQEAIELEIKAIALAQGNVKVILEKTLAGYRRGELIKPAN